MVPGTSWKAYYNGFITKVAAGVPVDVALLDMQAIPLGAKGVFIDLTPFIRQDHLAASVPPISLAAYAVQGKTYGFPTDLYPNVIYYNEDMLDQAGLALPPPEWRAAGWTWDDFAKDAVKLTVRDASGNITQWGARSLVDRASAIIDSFGGQLLTPQGFNIDDPGSLTALN